MKKLISSFFLVFLLFFLIGFTKNVHAINELLRSRTAEYPAESFSANHSSRSPVPDGTGRGIRTQNKSVCIDPGHGGTEIGTSNNGILEKNLNLDVANRLADLLTKNGITFYQTRTGDQTLSNNDRYTFCNSKGANILISIHHNGSTDSNLDYSSALYMKKTDVILAKTIVDTLSTKLGINNRGISRFASGVLLKAKMPATISEGFFLTSSYEYDLLNSTTLDRKQDEAQGLFEGILSYFSTH